MAEWSIAMVLKTIKGNTFGGSNPSLSAEYIYFNIRLIFIPVLELIFLLNIYYFVLNYTKISNFCI